MKLVPLAILVLCGLLAAPVWAADYPAGSVFVTGEGNYIIIGPAFTADDDYVSNSFIMFTGFNGEFDLIGFHGSGWGENLTISSITHTQITMMGVMDKTYYLRFTPTPTASIVSGGSCRWTDMIAVGSVLAVTQSGGVPVVVALDWDEGGDGETPIEEPTGGEAPPTQFDEAPAWVPPAIVEVIEIVYPWWQRYGAAVIVFAVVVAFIMYADRGGARKDNLLDKVLNPERL